MNNKTILLLNSAFKRYEELYSHIQQLIINYIQNSKETVYSRLHYLFQQVCNKESENWSVFYTLFKKTK